MNFKKYLVSATAAALIATSALSVSNFTAQASATTATTSADVVAASTFSAMPFTFLKEDKSGISTGMSKSALSTAQIEKTADGKLFAYVTETNASMWTGFKVKVNGEFVEAEKVYEETDETGKAVKRLVKFEISSLTDVIESQISVDANGYAMTYKVWLDFNNETVKDQEFKAWDEKVAAVSKGVTGQVYTTAQVEEVDGKKYAYITLKNNNYWTGFKSNVDGELVESEVVYNNDVNKTRVVKIQIPTTNQLVETESHIVAGAYDSKYATYFDFNNFYNGVTEEVVSIGKKNYTAWDASLIKTTSMATYTSKSAEFLVINGQKYIQVELNTTDQFREMQTEVNGVMTDVIEVSRDDEAKTRVVRFQVDSFKTAIKANAHIVVETSNYDANHIYYLDFNNLVSDIKTVKFESYNEKKTAKVDTTALLNPETTIRTYAGETKAIIKVLDRSVLTAVKVKAGDEYKDATVLSDGGKWSQSQTLEIAVPNYGTKAVEVQLTTTKDGKATTQTVNLDFNNVVKLEAEKPEVVAPVVNPNKVVSTTKYNYSLVTKTKKAKSAANAYVVKPLTVTKTQSGKYYATVKLKNSGMWKSLKAEVNGKMVNVTTVATDKAKKTKTVKFQVKSPTAVVKTTFKLNTKSKKLAGSYTNYFKLGKKYVKATTVTSTKKYNYSTLKEDKKSVSATDSYMVKPATIEKMSDGKYYATITIKNASLWKSFKTQVNGKMVEVTTVSSNKTKDTKVVKFQVPSAKATIKTTTHIKFSGYDNKYTNYLKLGSEIKK